MTNVIVVGGSDETRLLLRGLLRLHRQRVVGEGNSAEYLSKIPPITEETILLLDVDLGDEQWAKAVGDVLARHRPKLRGILLTPSRSPRVENQARAAGISCLVRRPFAVHELLEAVTQGPGAVPPT